MWYDYARWHADAGDGVASATTTLLRAVAALPNCLLLHFALADLEEAQGNRAAATEVCRNVLLVAFACVLCDLHRNAVAHSISWPGQVIVR